MTGKELFKKILESGRLVLMMFTDVDGEEVHTMAALDPSGEEMKDTLESLQRQAHGLGKVVCLDLSLMDAGDFEAINPQEDLLQ